MNTALNNQLALAQQAANDAARRVVELEVRMLRAELVECAGAHLDVTAVGFDASWEYDEGSYYWMDVPYVRLEGELDELTETGLYGEHDNLATVLEDVARFSHEAWKAAIPDADDEHGEVAVSALRVLAS